MIIEIDTIYLRTIIIILYLNFSFVNASIFCRWEDAGQVPREVWTKAGDLGFIGVAVPEKYGGPGGSFLDATVLIEEQ